VGLERRAEATALVEGFVQQQPQRWHLRLLLAELRREQNDLAGAERELQQLLSRQPDQVEALQLLALLQLESGRGSQAQMRVQAALNRASKPKLLPQALPIGLLLANLQLKRGQAAQAQALLGGLARDFPQDPRPLLARALIEQDQGQGAAAQASLAAARSLTPGKGDPRLDQLAAAWQMQALQGQALQGQALQGQALQGQSEVKVDGAKARAGGPSAGATSSPAEGRTTAGPTAEGPGAAEPAAAEPRRLPQ
jgi:predicted Zn-dependent protease